MIRSRNQCLWLPDLSIVTQICFCSSFDSIAFFAKFNSKRATSAASRQATFRKINIVVFYWRSRGLLLLSIALLAWSFSAVCLIFQPSCTIPDPPSVDQFVFTYLAFDAWRTRSALPHLIGQFWYWRLLIHLKSLDLVIPYIMSFWIPYFNNNY